MKNTIFPHKFRSPFLDCMSRLFFRPQYVWYPVHLNRPLIPSPPKLYWSIGRTNYLYYSTRVDPYSHQILLGIPGVINPGAFLCNSFLLNFRQNSGGFSSFAFKILNSTYHWSLYSYNIWNEKYTQFVQCFYDIIMLSGPAWYISRYSSFFPLQLKVPFRWGYNEIYV